MELRCADTDREEKPLHTRPPPACFVFYLPFFLKLPSDTHAISRPTAKVIIVID